MANLVTADDIREITGIQSDIVSDATITAIITDVQAKAISYFKVNLTPTKKIEIRDGNGKNTIRVNYPYLWKVLELKTNTTTIDLDNVTIDPQSSIITVDNTQNPYYFYKYQKGVKIKYLSAFMERTDTITESSAAVVVGTSVAIAVDDETGFATNDWVIIEGTDGKIEAAQITGTSTNEITVDQLVQDHAIDSVITKLQTHQLFTDFVRYESAVTTAINAVGGSYNFATSYSLPEFSVNKGVPYPHFEKNLNSNIKQRDFIKRQIFNKLNPMA